MKNILIISLTLITAISQSFDSPKLTGFNWGLSGRQGRQPDMRDATVAQLNFGGSPNSAFFGMYEGYGSSKSSRVMAIGLKKIKPLHQLIASPEKKPEEPTSRSDSIKHAYQAMDANLKFFVEGKSIATALTALIEERDDGPILYLAGVGNSRAVLVNQNGTVAYETQGHTIDNSAEIDRLAQLYPVPKKELLESHPDSAPLLYQSIFQLPRTPSGKFITRALGTQVKRTAEGKLTTTIPTPEIERINLKPQHKALILASDGLWDTMNSDYATQYVVHKLKYSFEITDNNEQATLIAKELSDIAYNAGSIDNISVIVVQFI